MKSYFDYSLTIDLGLVVSYVAANFLLQHS